MALWSGVPRSLTQEYKKGGEAETSNTAILIILESPGKQLFNTYL